MMPGTVIDFVALLETRFRTWSGCVDLLAMANAVETDVFRAYIRACRAIRADRAA